jgi:hypothetical protein
LQRRVRAPFRRNIDWRLNGAQVRKNQKTGAVDHASFPEEGVVVHNQLKKVENVVVPPLHGRSDL